VSFSKNPAAPLESLIFEMSEDLISWVPFIPSPESITLRTVGDLEKVTLRMPGIYDNVYIRLGLNIPD
jgi:hypothetical protein